MRLGITKCKGGWRVDVAYGLAVRCIGLYVTKSLAAAALDAEMERQHHVRNRTDVR
jgi:hypothetical protein